MSKLHFELYDHLSKYKGKHFYEDFYMEDIDDEFDNNSMIGVIRLSGYAVQYTRKSFVEECKKLDLHCRHFKILIKKANPIFKLLFNSKDVYAEGIRVYYV